jgi:alkylhydroperoxidase family enzyme
MRLGILDNGHRLPAKALFGVIALMTRQPVVDAVKLAFYRKDFYGAGPLTNEAMRGPSEWSVGDRELMAAFVAMANECPFCVAAHSATSGLSYGDDAKVAATLADLDTAPIEEPLRATLRMLGKLARENSLGADDVRSVLDAGVTPAQIEDALAVSLAFNITARLANAFGFDLASPAAMTAGAKHLLKRGYG